MTGANTCPAKVTMEVSTPRQLYRFPMEVLLRPPGHATHLSRKTIDR